MFSGLTNQVTSWMGQAKPHDEEVPAPPPTQPEKPEVAEIEKVEETPVDTTNEENAHKTSPTKATGGMFSSVKSSMTGWLGNASSAIPTVSMPSVSMPSMPAMPAMPSIPGLKKSQPSTTEEPTDQQPAVDEHNENATALTSADLGTAGTGAIDEDDRSSATGGADSERGSPTEEQAATGVGNVTHKVTAGAKSFGSFLAGAVSKAGAKIKETVKDNPILGEFNKEQEAFIKGQSGKNTEPGVCPWIGHANEEKIKEEVLSLSSDRRNFVRAPPAGVDYEFDYDTTYPVALALMNEDLALEKMRFELVPKIITEENFWRNYFYRVSLIIQAGDLGTLDSLGQRDDDDVKKTRDSNETKSQDEKTKVHEFVSDSFKSVASEKDLNEIQENIKKLGIDSLACDGSLSVDDKSTSKNNNNGDEEWEKDLEAELNDFEIDDKNDDDDLLDDSIDIK